MVKISNDFFSNYAFCYGYTDGSKNKFASLFKKSLYIKVFINGNLFNISIGEFIESHSEFIFVSDQEDFEMIENISLNEEAIS